MDAWLASGRPLASTEQIDVSELGRRLDAGVQRVVDVRRPGERESARIDGSIPIPLHQLASRVGELDRSAPVATICAGGYRSAIAASVLERAGFTKTTNVVGGMDAWTVSGLPTRVGSGSLEAS